MVYGLETMKIDNESLFVVEELDPQQVCKVYSNIPKHAVDCCRYSPEHTQFQLIVLLTQKNDALCVVGANPRLKGYIALLTIAFRMVCLSVAFRDHSSYSQSKIRPTCNHSCKTKARRCNAGMTMMMLMRI